MATYLEIDAEEEGAIVITAAFADEDGNAVTPTTVTWTLTDVSGTVINSLEDQSETPDTSIEIMLKGNDLQLLAGEQGKGSAERIFTIKAPYTSPTFGAGIPNTTARRFRVKDRVMVT